MKLGSKGMASGILRSTGVPSATPVKVPGGALLTGQPKVAVKSINGRNNTAGALKKVSGGRDGTAC